jgi:hypothetical protein
MGSKCCEFVLLSSSFAPSFFNRRSQVVIDQVTTYSTEKIEAFDMRLQKGLFPLSGVDYDKWSDAMA